MHRALSKCEGCGEPHDGTYGSGRFCTKACAGKKTEQKASDGKASKKIDATATVRCEACSRVHNGSCSSDSFCDTSCHSKLSAVPARARTQTAQKRKYQQQKENEEEEQEQEQEEEEQQEQQEEAKEHKQEMKTEEEDDVDADADEAEESLHDSKTINGHRLLVAANGRPYRRACSRCLQTPNSKSHQQTAFLVCTAQRCNMKDSASPADLNHTVCHRYCTKCLINVFHYEVESMVAGTFICPECLENSQAASPMQPVSAASMQSNLGKPNASAQVKNEQRDECGPRQELVQRPVRDRRVPKLFHREASELRDLRAHRTVPKVSPGHRLESGIQDGNNEAVQGTRVRARKHPDLPFAVYSRKVNSEEWKKHKSIHDAARARGLSHQDLDGISQCCDSDTPEWKGFEFKHAIPTSAVPAAKRSTRVQLDEALEDTVASSITPAKRLPGLQEAPVFYPTEEEFLDPMGYIESIRPRAEHFGICNIVPPSSWKSELCLDPELKFQASKQKLHMAPLPGQPIGFRKSKRLFTKDSFASHAVVLARKLYGRAMVELGENSAEDPCTLEAQYWHLAEKHSAREQACQMPKTSGHAKKIPESLYGSDIISTGHDNGTDWNLCRLAGLSDNILHYVSYPIHGVNTPMLYFGMLFSRFCWHVEDDDLNSISYLHEGAPKTWWGVPASAADGFESVFREQYAELMKDFPSLQYSKGVMLNPEKLLQAGVPVSHVLHRPGTFVVTFPHAYHCGFNHGVNVAEAVNFAGFDWLQHGMKCMNLYRKIPVVKSSVLAFEKLLCDLARHSKELSSQLADETYAHLENVANEYNSFLTDIKATGLMSLELADTPSDSNSLGVMCSVCQHHCYIMGIHCQQAVTASSNSKPDERWSCSRHFGLLRDQGFTELTCCVFAPLGMVRGLLGQIRQTKELRAQSCNDQTSSALSSRRASTRETSGQPYQNVSTVTVGSRVAVTDDPTVTGRVDSINHGYAQLTLDTGRRRAFRIGNLMRIGGDAAVADQPMAATNVRWTQCCAVGCERWHELPIGHPIPSAGHFVCAMNSWNPEISSCPSIEPGPDTICEEEGDDGEEENDLYECETQREEVEASNSLAARQLISPSEPASDRPAKRPRSISNDKAISGTGKALLAKSVSGGNQSFRAESPHRENGSVENADNTSVATSGRNLSQAQYKLAAQLLSPYFDHRLGAKQFQHKKQELIDMINKEFRRLGLPGQYTSYKLDLWVANSMKKARTEAAADMDKHDERSAKGVAHVAPSAAATIIQPTQRLQPTPRQVIQQQHTQMLMPPQYHWAQAPQTISPQVVWVPLVTCQRPQLLLPAQQQPTVRSMASVQTTHTGHTATGLGLGVTSHHQTFMQVPDNSSSVGNSTAADLSQFEVSSSMQFMQANHSVRSGNRATVAESARATIVDTPAVARASRVEHSATVAADDHVRITSTAGHQVQNHVQNHLQEQHPNVAQQQMMLGAEQLRMQMQIRAELQRQHLDQVSDVRAL